LKTTGLELKPYAVRERVAPVVGEEPQVFTLLLILGKLVTLLSAQGGWPLYAMLEPQ